MCTIEETPLTTPPAAARPGLLAERGYQSDIPRRLRRYQPTDDLRRAASAFARTRARNVGPRWYCPRMTGESIDPRQRQTLGALRYAVNDDATTYPAIMRLITSGMSGFLSDQSADDENEPLAELGLVIERDAVDLRLSYLVEHGNLARSPRETEARSVRDYPSNRARYQLTQRGEVVHRQVEEFRAPRPSRRRPGRGDHGAPPATESNRSSTPPAGG